MADPSSSTVLPADQLQNLHLDGVSGERVSKSELKRRQKQRAQEEKKKEKAADAAARPVPEKKPSAEDEESELSPNVRLQPFLPLALKFVSLVF
jgi:lysyl-tRNA synthetase class 2